MVHGTVPRVLVPDPPWVPSMFAERDVPFEGLEHRNEAAASGMDWIRALPTPRRGRPPKMTAPELLDRIRRLAGSRAGLFRVHQRFASLYARARRHFGSWSAAVAAAGLDYRETLNGARLRSLKTRRRARRAVRR